MSDARKPQCGWSDRSVEQLSVPNVGTSHGEDAAFGAAGRRPGPRRARFVVTTSLQTLFGRRARPSFVLLVVTVCSFAVVYGPTARSTAAETPTLVRHALEWPKGLVRKGRQLLHATRTKARGRPAGPGVAAGGFLPRPAASPDANTVRQLAVARQLYHAGQLREAERRLQQLAKKQPGDVETRLLLAEVALDAGDLTTYVECLRVLIALNGQSPELLSAAGSRLAQCASAVADSKDVQRVAVSALRRAAEQQPSNERFARSLAAALVLQERWDEALGVLKKLQTQHPRDVDSLAVLALLSERAGRWQEAADLYGVLCQTEPERLRWHRGRGRCAYNAGDFQTAHDELAQCFQTAPTECTPAELVALADASLRVGHYALAERALQTVAALQPKPVRDVELLRALCSLRQGDPVRARGILNVALTYWPEDRVLRQTLALCEQRTTGPSVPPSVPARTNSTGIVLTSGQQPATAQPAPANEQD